MLRRHFLNSTPPRAVVGTLASLAQACVDASQAADIKRAPVLFIRHGSPMNALLDNDFTRTLRTWGSRLSRPAAALVVSAHWLTPGETAVGVQDKPRTIHDFRGFPQPLFDMLYPAPGSPAFAREAAVLIKRAKVQARTDWGLDHGTWSVLHHLFPAADVPVFQLSIDYNQPAAFHHALGRELAALRSRGVLIIGSGNIVHNLRQTDRAEQTAGTRPTASRAWAQTFDDAVKKALAQRDDMALVNYTRLDAPSARIAVETPDHYYPFLYALGAADSLQEVPQTIFEGFHSGTLSMRCLQFGTA